jgi:hypothetical protein
VSDQKLARQLEGGALVEALLRPLTILAYAMRHQVAHPLVALPAKVAFLGPSGHQPADKTAKSVENDPKLTRNS